MGPARTLKRVRPRSATSLSATVAPRPPTKTATFALLVPRDLTSQQSSGFDYRRRHA